MTWPRHRLRIGADTLDGALSEWARAAQDHPALRHADEVWTYGQLDSAVDRVAGKLSDELEVGDRVVLVGHNSTAWVITFLAVMRAGAVIVPANNRASPKQLRDQCSLLEAKLVLHDDAHHHLVAGAGVRVAEAETYVREALMDDSGQLAQTREPNGQTLALISFTSGTTGDPKGAMVTHEALFRGSAVHVECLGTTDRDSTLVVVPLFHNTGFVDQLGHMLVAGGSTHLLSRYRTTTTIEELTARPVTHLAAVPSIIRMLMMADGADKVFAGLGTILFGGSPMPKAWSAELNHRWPGVRLVHGYGLTEFTSVCTLLPPQMIADRGDSVGITPHDVEVKIVGADNREVATGVSGEVWVSGPTMMLGYWRRSDLTSEKIVGPWLRTGDRGHLDADGFLWLSGRVDDMINRGGEKVLPAEVEAEIAELPYVAEAVVFGVPDPVLHNRIVAVVRPRPGCRFDEVDARARLVSTVADYAVPEDWVVQSDELPRAASGKTDRRGIRARYLEAIRST